MHDVFVGGEQLHQRRQERRDDVLRNLLSEHRQKFERVGANHGMRATLGSLKLRGDVLVEKVDDVYQIVGFRRTLHQRLRAHRERDDQIDGRVLRLPKFFRIRRVLRTIFCVFLYSMYREAVTDVLTCCEFIFFFSKQSRSTLQTDFGMKITYCVAKMD